MCDVQWGPGDSSHSAGHQEEQGADEQQGEDGEDDENLLRCC